MRPFEKLCHDASLTRAGAAHHGGFTQGINDNYFNELSDGEVFGASPEGPWERPASPPEAPESAH
jgi:hypothetical protein